MGVSREAKKQAKEGGLRLQALRERDYEEYLRLARCSCSYAVLLSLVWSSVSLAAGQALDPEGRPRSCGRMLSHCISGR